MRKKVFRVTVLLGLVVFLISFFVWNSQYTLSGNAILSINDSKEVQHENVSGSMALEAIRNSEKLIAKMESYNFSVVYVSELLINANKTFEVVKSVEIVKSASATVEEKNAAQNNLKLVNWKDLDYSDVTNLTNIISNRFEESLAIYDTINLIEKESALYESQGIDVSSVRFILNQAKDSFYNERYDESRDLLVKSRDELEKKRQESSRFAILQRGVLNFIQKYWFFIILVLLILAFIVYFVLNKFNRHRLIKKIEKMHYEKRALVDLIKKVQRDRFENNKIPGLVYNIRVEKYKTRLSQIERTLPILERKLDKQRKH